MIGNIISGIFLGIMTHFVINGIGGYSYEDLKQAMSKNEEKYETDHRKQNGISDEIKEPIEEISIN